MTHEYSFASSQLKLLPFDLKSPFIYCKVASLSVFVCIFLDTLNFYNFFLIKSQALNFVVKEEYFYMI